MNALPLIDLLAFAGFLISFLLVLRADRSLLPRSSQLILLVVIGTRVFIGAADVLEDSKITGILDLWEDYASILFMPLFILFVYTLMNDEEMRKKAKWQGELQAANEELEAQYRDLQRLDDMKDSFIRDVCHELKTPVAKHAMQVEILRKFAQDRGIEKEMEPNLRVLSQTVERQNHVIRNLLELSRLEDGARSFRRESFRLDDLMDRVLDDYRFTIDAHRVELTADLPPVQVEGDEEMLWHVFSNIVNNAVKFRTREGTPRIDVSVERSPSEVSVLVSDNGVGITGETGRRAFDKFYQATASREGSGVGLTISRMIVEKLGGRISLRPASDGSGAVAVVSLPLRGPAPSPGRAADVT